MRKDYIKACCDVVLQINYERETDVSGKKLEGRRDIRRTRWTVQHHGMKYLFQK